MALRVYLACTIRGDRSRLAVARAIGRAIEARGHEVMTGRFLDERAEDEDGRLTPAQVFERDIAWLDGCDLLVAEASGSSFGVGFEVGYMLGSAGRTGTCAIVLYDTSLADRISRLVTGNTHARCLTIAYRDADDASRQLDDALAGLERRS